MRVVTPEIGYWVANTSETYTYESVYPWTLKHTHGNTELESESIDLRDILIGLATGEFIHDSNGRSHPKDCPEVREGSYTYREDPPKLDRIEYLH